MPVSTNNTDVLTASLGRPIVLAYGKHLVGGNVILMDQTDPNSTILLIALGEGEWDSILALNVNAQDWNITIPQNYQFHKGLVGQLSSDGTLSPEGSGSLYPFDQDGDQKVDSLTPPGVQGLTFSRTAYLALRVPFDVYAPGPNITVIGVYQTRKVRIFSLAGVQTGFAFSDNPVWQIADLLTVVRGLSDARIDWASFAIAAAYCAQQISINGMNVPRFVSNVAFTQVVSMDQALQALLATCRGSLLETEGTIKLRIDQPRSPIFDFTMDNIVKGSFSAQWQNTRATANRLAMSFRDTDNDYALVSKLWNHEPQQARTGRIVTAQLDLGNMPQHQAERIGDYLLTRAIDNNLYCKLRATQASLAVMPGDVVRVKHDAAPWGAAPGDSLFETFEVIEVTDNIDETRDFTLQLYRDSTYPDTAGPTQNLVGTTIRGRPAAPDAPPNWSLTANLGGELRLSFAIPQGADYRTGDLTLLADDEINRVSATLGADLAAVDTIMTVADSTGFLVGDYVNVGTEILKIEGPGVEGALPTAAVWQVGRAQKLTDAGAAVSGAVVYRLTEIPLHFVLPAGYTLAHPTVNLADTSQYYVLRIRPGRLRILYASLVMGGIGGASDMVEQGFALLGAFEPNVTGTLAGLRSSSGGLGTIQIAGPLATGDDLAMPLVLPNGVSIGIVYAAVATSPGGQPIQLQLKLNGVNFGPVAQIPVAPDGGASGSGVFVSGAQKGNVSGAGISVSIIQAGSDNPGEDLTVYVTV